MSEETKIKFEHLQNALRFMFEGSDIDRRYYLHRMAQRYPELKRLAEKYPYQPSVLRTETPLNIQCLYCGNTVTHSESIIGRCCDECLEAAEKIWKSVSV